MRLLRTDVQDLVLEDVFDEYEENPTKYAILSHTWLADKEEVKFVDRQLPIEELKAREGWSKVEGSKRQALKDGWKYIWIDTLCIDKSSSTELGEAINSMYRWYEKSQVCYVYLQDLPDPTLFIENHDVRAALDANLRMSNAEDQSDETPGEDAKLAPGPPRLDDVRDNAQLDHDPVLVDQINETRGEDLHAAAVLPDPSNDPYAPQVCDFPYAMMTPAITEIGTQISEPPSNPGIITTDQDAILVAGTSGPIVRSTSRQTDVVRGSGDGALTAGQSGSADRDIEMNPLVPRFEPVESTKAKSEYLILSDGTSLNLLKFRKCRWFTRGWTLQELLAPTEVLYFSTSWVKLDRQLLFQEIGDITGIHVEALSKARRIET